jgi:hypothetical protein
MDLKTDYASTFKESSMDLMGYQMAKAAAQTVYEKTGITPKDV